jgi:hypothetical protein
MKKKYTVCTVGMVFLLFVFWFLSCEQSGGVIPPVLDSEANLASLTPSAGVLSPPFDPGITVYTAVVSNAVKSLTITGVPESAAARTGRDNGTEKLLDVGENEPIVILVIAEDVTNKTYTLTVTRLDGSTSVIVTPQDMEKIGVHEDFPLANNYILDADIELENWTPVGTGPETAFSGTFNGNNKKITIKSFNEHAFGEESAYLGIFGYTRGSDTAPVVIKDLTVESRIDHVIQHTGDCYAGALIGYAGEYTGLSNITVKGSISFTNNNTTNPRKPVYVGGIAGALIASEIKDSAVEASVTGFGTAGGGQYNYVGGLAGMFDRNQLSGGNVIPGTPFAGSSITNSYSTGDVSGSTAGSGTNIFVGGIAGGSRYAMKTYYSGKIEDCYSTGNVTASGGGYWSWAGGIAGIIAGDGDGNPQTGHTRIVRCYAAGDIKTDAPDRSWPYAGGIAANNYYGGLISQCYFTGNVTAAGTGTYYDYTGGIAGYNSKEYNRSSIIEDCYTAAGVTISGRINGGGIVGQNQVAARVERCYSRAVITISAGAESGGAQSQQGIGGIAGYNAKADTYNQPGVIQNCVALNPSLSTGGFTGVHRVVGQDPGGFLGSNFASSDMTVTIAGEPSPQSDQGHDKKDGAACAARPEQFFYERLGWDFTDIWVMNEGYPELKWRDSKTEI